MEKAKLFRINGRDLIKGLIMSVLSVIITATITIINARGLPTLNDWKSIGMLAVITGLTYISKNFLTNSDDKLLTGEDDTKIGTGGKAMMIIGFMLISSMAFSAGDSVGVNAVKDSVPIANGIMAGVNGVIKVLPQDNPGVSIFVLINSIFGALLTGAGIHWFGTRHGKKLKQ